MSSRIKQECIGCLHFITSDIAYCNLFKLKPEGTCTLALYKQRVIEAARYEADYRAFYGSSYHRLSVKFNPQQPIPIDITYRED